MKKIILGISLLSVLSCGSDNDNSSNSNTAASLIGIWKIERVVTISGADQTTQIDEDLPDACKNQSTYEYTSNGKYIAKDYNMVGSTCQFSQSTRNYVYTPSTQKLMIDNMESKVLELTANKLMIYINDGYDSNGDGVDDYLKYTFVR